MQDLSGSQGHLEGATVGVGGFPNIATHYGGKQFREETPKGVTRKPQKGVIVLVSKDLRVELTHFRHKSKIAKTAGRYRIDTASNRRAATVDAISAKRALQ